MDDKELHKHYRPNVGIVLFNREGAVWYGRRVGKTASAENDSTLFRWQMPQGGIDSGEETISAAYRELKEETGIDNAQLLVLTPGWLVYDFPPEYAKRKGWKGQRQKWAAMLFQGKDTDFNLEADHHQEFDNWRWGTLEEAPSLIVPFKQHVYKEVVRAFTPLRDFLKAQPCSND